MQRRFLSGATRAVVLSLGVFIGLAAAGPVDSFAASAGSSGVGFSYVAAPGEVNTVTVSYALRVFTITDSTATITPALGCSAVTAHQVTCDNSGVNESVISFTIDTGDMNDSVTVESAPVGMSPNQISGGDGADTLTGGPEIDALDDGAGNDTVNGGAGDDVLRSGPGADVLMGGPGTDIVTYSTHSPAVVVTVDGNANDGNADDGPSGARDNVAPDVEDLQGSAGVDTLTGSAGNNDLTGYDDNDTLNGGAGDDVLDDVAGDNTPNGDGGDDMLRGGGGADTMNGGDGIDTADYSGHIFMAPPVTVTLDGVADDGFAGENDNAGTDVENIIGSGNEDHLTGSGSANVLLGGSGNDTLDGLGGDDVLIGDSALGFALGQEESDILNGGAGDDLLHGGLGADIVNGGPGFDFADYSDRATNVRVELDGVANDGGASDNGDGEDGDGDNVGTDVEGVFGGDGDDTLIGNAQPNELDGGGGDDLLDGGLGADALIGGEGLSDTADYSSRVGSVTVRLDGTATSGEVGENDTIAGDVEDAIGGSAADSFVGSDGDNSFDGGPAADTFSGGDGFDAVDYSSRSVAVNVSLDGTANDGAAGESDNVGAGMEDAFGGSGSDHFTGNDASNFFAGGAGADVFTGAGGDDFLVGEAGADSLNGGGGFDVFDGGADNDSTQSRDSLAENVACGSGNDAVVADLADSTSACETTHRGPPVVTTGAAREITQTTATLAATLNPAGQAATAYVEIGTTTVYGTRSPTLSLPAEVAEYAVTSTWSNLQVGTTYHYRFVATNADGTTHGPDQTFATAAPNGADLALTIEDLPDPATVGKRLSYILTVANRGPVQAAAVRVDDSLPRKVALVSATPSQGTCSSKAPVRCELGSLAGGASATVEVVVRLRATGMISNTATVSAATVDPVTANNSATATSTVKGAPCVVPNVKRKTLAAAKKALVRAHCTLGKVRLAYSAKVKRGRVLTERPVPKTRLRSGGKVNVVVSRGQSR